MLAFTFTAGLIMLLPFTIAEYMAGYRMNPGPEAFAVFAFLVTCPSILSYITFNRGVELIGANRAGPFFHLITVFGSIAAIVFLGERPALYHVVGYVLIIAGIVVAQRGPASARPAPSEEG
jgi:drug/metabolite transporter (DMT)-like permease